MRNEKENIIVNKTFDFALNIIEFSEDLYEAKNFLWQIKFLNQELQLEQMLEKLKMQKVKQILFIN